MTLKIDNFIPASRFLDKCSLNVCKAEHNLNERLKAKRYIPQEIQGQKRIIDNWSRSEMAKLKDIVFLGDEDGNFKTITQMEKEKKQKEMVFYEDEDGNVKSEEEMKEELDKERNDTSVKWTGNEPIECNIKNEKDDVEIIDITKPKELKKLGTFRLAESTPLSQEALDELSSYDNVNNPKHYNRNDSFGETECIDAIKSSMPKEAFLGYCKGNAIKYIWRYDYKNGKEDLEKARWYINSMIECLEEIEINKNWEELGKELDEYLDNENYIDDEGTFVSFEDFMRERLELNDDT